MTSVASSDVTISLFVNKSESRHVFHTPHRADVQVSGQCLTISRIILSYVFCDTRYSPLLLRLDPAHSLTFHIFMLCYIKYSLHRTPVRTLRHRKVVISSRQLFLGRDNSQITKPADQSRYDYYHRYQEPRPALQLPP